MKKGDIVVCINVGMLYFEKEDDFSSGYKLILYNEYTIKTSFYEFIELEGIPNCLYDAIRFIPLKKYRKIKLKQLKEL